MPDWGLQNVSTQLADYRMPVGITSQVRLLLFPLTDLDARKDYINCKLIPAL